MLNVPRHGSIQIDIGVFGGSGFYELLPGVDEVNVETPFGTPSAPIAIAEVEGTRIGFMARHGAKHQHPAHRVNYRANAWALAHLGASHVLSPFACGSLRADWVPGDVVVVDQLIDRTTNRECTFFDGPEVWHQGFADPYDQETGAVIAEVAQRQGLRVHRGGTVVVISGPRFSTRAESKWHIGMGADLVNMTQYPEAVLAAEAGMAYSGIGIVTDFDCGIDDDPTIAAVHQDDVFALLAKHASVMRDLILETAPLISVT